MESAPLTRAHDHAREASLATNMADTVVAVNEHVLAAGEFATAARDTSSIEALRTLHLLERHHERLARLLQHSLEHPPPPEQRDKTHEEKDVATTAGDASEAGKTGPAHSIATTAGKATATPASVSGVVSRGEFANAGTAGSGVGADADAQGVAFGGDGTASSVRMADDKSGSSSAAAAAVSAAAGTAQKAGAAAMASVQSQQRRHPPSRELSSSIATNLASARGIRSSRYHRGQPAAPSMSTDQAPGSLDGQGPKAGGSRAQMQNVLQQQKQQKQQKQQQSGGAGGQPSWVPPKHPQRKEEDVFLGGQTEGGGGGGGGGSSEGFARFYDRFGSFINRLSAPLAFAGLPLVAEDIDASTTDAAAKKAGQATGGGSAQRHSRTQSSPTSSMGASRTSAAAEPDLSQIYSKAALRAVNRDGLGGNPSDSFYVVPKTGHTASYANILSFEQKEQRRRLAASAVLVNGEGLEEEEQLGDDDYEHGFADARNQQPARSGLLKRLTATDPSRSGIGISNHSSNSAANKHLVEELKTENEGLKDMLDRLSRRLHAFEASAQQSHMALQESMRFMHPAGTTGDAGSSLPSAGGGGSDAEALAQKNRELERELARMAQRLDALERDRAHQEKTLQKYRDKWEKLKAGAKARKEAQGSVESK